MNAHSVTWTKSSCPCTLPPACPVPDLCLPLPALCLTCACPCLPCASPVPHLCLPLLAQEMIRVTSINHTPTVKQADRILQTERPVTRLDYTQLCNTLCMSLPCMSSHSVLCPVFWRLSRTPTHMIVAVKSDVLDFFFCRVISLTCPCADDSHECR